MKREIPILLTVLCGLLITIAFFAPAHDPSRGLPPTIWQGINSELLQWGQVLVAVAFLLGIANVVRINLRQVAARHEDRWYKVVLLVSMFAFLVVGLADTHKSGLPGPLVRMLVPADHVTLADGSTLEAWVVQDAADGLHLRDGDGMAERVIPKSGFRAIEYRSAKMWVYFKLFAPLQATMFSLLAFYAASAMFRAFRARSLEATLLLVAGAIVMLGQVPLGDQLTGGLASPVKDFLMNNVVKAAERAIVIGASFGVLATGLRIVLGVERSYLSE
jgi:hypothetical protein